MEAGTIARGMEEGIKSIIYFKIVERLKIEKSESSIKFYTNLCYTINSKLKQFKECEFFELEWMNDEI